MSVFSRFRAHKAVRFASRSAAITAAILAAAIVSTLTIDLGPSLRALAERQGSQQLKRPIHIGRLSLHLLRGRVIVEDFSIEGLKPTDRPFFTAKHLAVGLEWSTALRREITIETVELTDWRMVVDKWEDRHNFPKFTSDNPTPDQPKRITTTLKMLHAYRGEFIYDDHESPWSIAAPNLDLTIDHPPVYSGTARFSGGTVRIQDNLPMWLNMQARFEIRKGGIVHLDRIDLQSDGATSQASGDVDLGNWPEQTFQVKSRVRFERMRQIFFTHDSFRVSGDGEFAGVFHLFKGGHDLHGTFTSELAGFNEYRFPALYGSLRWTPAGFDVSNAGSRVYGGTSTFNLAITRGQPHGTGRFDATYDNVDLSVFSDFKQLSGQRFAGRASGRNVIEWPLGRASDYRDEGQVTVVPPPGVALMTPSLDAERARDAAHARHEWGPYAPIPLPPHLPIGGSISYTFDRDHIDVDSGRFMTARTHVTFRGGTDWGERSRFDFHVTSADLQDSDELLAGIISDFGSKTNSVAFGGRGEFDGVMTGPFRRIRVEGTFAGDDLRAWDTIWGAGSARIVFHDSYVDVTNGLVRLDGSEIHVDGRFSTQYPRDDGGDELNGRFRVVKRDLDGLRHAFQLDDYPVSGLLSGEFQLAGPHDRPLGFGAMTIENGAAWREPFQTATAALRFDGTGVRLDSVTIAKAGGTVTGAAFVGWNSTYSFRADGKRIPVERISGLTYPRTPLSGIAEFTAEGAGTFDDPRYSVRFRVNDLFIAEEGIGQVTGSVELRNNELSGEVVAASPRLAITGTGRIALTPQADSELTFRFHDTSLDPYVRLFVPRLSPYTTAIANGTIRVVGELADPDHLLVDGRVDSIEMGLFDYKLKNAAPIHLVLDQRQVRLEDLQIAGEGTALRLSGAVGLADERIGITVEGEASLGILQAFFRDVRGSGRARLTASIDGPLRAPLFSGSAAITDGRIRHFSLPNSLDGINGTIQFDPHGVRLDDLTATLGGGRVQFGGRVGFDGYVPGEINVTARADDVHLRYPEGVRSTVDADLTLRGTFKTPTLGGVVTVKYAAWTRRIETPDNLLGLTGRRGGPETGGGGGEPTPLPLRFDLQVLVPSTLHIENNLARMVASADLTLRGTYDRPVLFGHADVERGEILFEGRRYRVTRGTIDFTNPARIEPFFDVEVETVVRVPGQTYRVTASLTGTTERFAPSFSSDPPLPTADVLALLLSDVRRTDAAELRALQNPNQTQTDILQTRATQILAGPVSEQVSKVVEQTFGVDTFQLSPSFVDPYGLQSGVNPTARVTIGKRISDRAYLTYSRSINSTFYDQIIVLEYDQNDRLSWILSRNEDATYAIEFRVRHIF